MARRALWAALAVSAVLGALLLWGPEEPPPETSLRHLPMRYWTHRDLNAHRYNQSHCISVPGPREIKNDVPFWQLVTAESFVFAAHWDSRSEPCVRLLVHSARPLPQLRCLFWYYDVGDPVPAEASVYAQDDDDALRVVSCALPAAPRAEFGAVSLVATDFICGKPPNILSIQGKSLSEEDGRAGAGWRATGAGRGGRARGGGAAVCAVWRRRGDAAARLLEWLILLHHFGVDRVYLYINQGHDNVMHVLDYFKWQRNITMVEATPYVSPFASPNIHRHRNVQPSHRTPRNLLASEEEYQVSADDGEADAARTSPISSDDLLPHNDCLYRALGERLSWLVILDLDEIIVPLRDGKWLALSARESREAVGAGSELPDVLSFRRFWFPALLQPARAAPAPRTRARVPPPRMFEYEWRAPTPHDRDDITAKMLRTASIVRVGVRQASCLLDACSVWNVESACARVHAYSARCGGAGRAACRALRPLAVRDREMRQRWGHVKAQVQNTLQRLQLQPHSYQYFDEE